LILPKFLLSCAFAKADVVKLAYTTALGAVGRKTVGVRVSPSADLKLLGWLFGFGNCHKPALGIEKNESGAV
jgi:hypothetical protein